MKEKGQEKRILQDPYWMNIYVNFADSSKEKIENNLDMKDKMKIKSKIFLTIIICLSTYFIQSMEQQDNVKLESSDEQQFQVPINIVEKSETIKDLVKELAEIVAPTESIYLPNVSGEVLGFILDLLREDLKNKELISGKIDQKIKKLSESNPIFGYQFLAAVNYLNISDLLTVVVKSVGQLMQTQIKESKKDALKFGLELIPHNLENQIKLIICTKILNHNSIVRSVAFSPDGKYIITGAFDKIAKWELNTGNLIHTFTGHIGRSVISMVLSPDGKYIIAGCWDNTAKLWDVNTGELIRTFTNYTGHVNSIAFSLDGRYFIAVYNQDNTAKLWDVNTGELIQTFTGHNSEVNSVAFSPDGKYILTGSSDNTAKLWDINTGEFIQTFTGHSSKVNSVAFSPSNSFVLTGSSDNTAKLWDINTGELIQTFTGHSCKVNSVVFSPDEECILAGCSDSRVRFWNLDTGTSMGYFPCYFFGHAGIVLSLAFSPNGRYIFTGSHSTILWDFSLLALNLKLGVFVLLCETLKGTEKAKALFADHYWHNVYLELKQLSAKGDQKVSKAFESGLNVAFESGLDKQQFQIPRKVAEKSITAKKFIEDHGTQDPILLPNTVKEELEFIFYLLNKDLTNPEISEEVKTKFFSSRVFGYRFLAAVNYLGIPDLLPVGISSLVQLIDYQIKEGNIDELKYGLELIPHNLENQIRRMIINKNLSLLDKYINFRILNHSESINSVTFRRDGRYILTGSGDCTAKLWDVNGNLIHTFTGHTNSINSVAFSPDGKYILTGSSDGIAKLWELNTGEIHNFTGQSGLINSVVFSPDGKYILIGFNDKIAKLWDVNGNLIHIFIGHTSRVNSVTFSPDGKYILTGSTDKTARLWNTDTGNLIQTFIYHNWPIYSIVFSPDGKYILTGSDYVADLWDINGNLIHTFRPGDTYYISSVAFGPDGKYILTGSDNSTAKLWDVNGNLIKTFTGHKSIVKSVAFNPDGKYILTGSCDKTARII